MDAIRAAALRVVLKCCAQDLERIVRRASAQEEHFGLSISLISLADHEPALAEALYARPMEVLTLLDEATVQAQVEMCAAVGRQHAEQQRRQSPAGGGQPQAALPCVNVYDNVHVRLVGLPTSLDPRPMPMRPSLSRLGCAQLHQLLSINGTVVRAGPVRMWESIQVYECTRCKTQ
ncbi:hypothetical protein TSOC_007632 [Tetrabaena socialis]|uniref:MCM9 N-terminal domain-containing protein n=1 Tax=Tetrabaena socialis TaxID=47790 RepID=A0A2J8A0I9_9CHLO|nr:hypothetical protein TSOC_007632 [Tetrabaena socialis]|eukprot:PNH06034.1 hypothetical protein TSOC_007632 [Tetrabaena socialis]